jgi:hypothetical protein
MPPRKRTEPVAVAAEPAEVRADTTGGTGPGHELELYSSESTGKFFGQCSCGKFSAAHHESQESVETAFTRHVERRKGN